MCCPLCISANLPLLHYFNILDRTCRYDGEQLMDGCFTCLCTDGVVVCNTNACEGR